MKSKNIVFLFIFCFLSACGYQPLNLNQKINYSILTFNLEGDNQINKILERNFEKYKDANNINSIKISSSSKVTKSESAKDTAGKAISYNLSININITATKNETKI